MNKITIFTLAILAPACVRASESSSSSSSSLASETPANTILHRVELLCQALETAQKRNAQAHTDENTELALLPDKGKKLLAARTTQDKSREEIRYAQQILNNRLYTLRSADIPIYDQNICYYEQEIERLQSEKNSSEESQKELAEMQQYLKQNETNKNNALAALAAGKARFKELMPKISDK